MKTTLAFLLFMTSLMSFANDKGGNGGGGICNAKKCMTLAEAGFRIPVTPEVRDDSYEVPFQILEELDVIIKEIPENLRKFRSIDVIGSKDSVIMIEVENDRRTKSFLKEYKRILASRGSNLKDSVEILAFTVPSDNGNKTYLIKDKFDALTVRGQALLLIHEYNLRSRNMTLENALIYDGALIDFLKAVETHQQVDMTTFVRAMVAVGMVLQRELDGYAFRDFLSAGQVFLSSDLQSLSTDNGQPTISFSYENLVRMKKYSPKLSQFLKSGEYAVQKEFRATIYQNFLLKIAQLAEESSSGKVIVTNAMYMDYLKESSSLYSTEYLRSADLCGGYDGKDVVLSSKEEIIDKPYMIDCALPGNLLLSRNGVYFNNYAIYLIVSGVKGLNLNLVQPVTCSKGDSRYTKTNIECSL